MLQILSFRKPKQETYEGRKIMTDPGVHGSVEQKICGLLKPGSSIIEIGAGAGAFALRMHKFGYDVHAVDIEDDKFDVPGVKFRKVSPEEQISAVFNHKLFDGVIAIEVIEHFRSTWKFFQEASELLAPNGRLFLTTPNLCSIYSRMVFLKEGRFFHFQGDDSWKMGHINPVPFFVLEETAKECGFKLIERQGVGYMPVLDWSNFQLRHLITALPRLLLFAMMRGPGPKEGNILFYLFEKQKESSKSSVPPNGEIIRS